MKYSDLDICNIALGLIGSDPIDDMSANHKKNRQCKLFYDITRDYLLTSFDWSFARKFQMLEAATLDAANVPPGLYAYDLPEDCEIPRFLYPLIQRESWEILGNSLFTRRDDDYVGLYYTRKDVRSFEFTTAFTNLMGIGVAVRLASPIVQDPELVSTLYSQFLQEQNNCMAIDANASNNYRAYDEDPNNDTFVNPGLDDFLAYTPGDGRAYT